MKKLLLIYNPHAGKGQIKARLSRIIEIFEEHGYLTTAYATQGRGDGVWAAAAMARDFDHIVVGGGDGTLSEVITGLPQDCRNRNIGYLPAGTTNDFSRTLALPGDDLEEAARLAVAGRAQRCDIGLINDHHILTYVAAFGVFSDTSYATPQTMKNLLGRTAYVLEGIKSLATLRPVRMKVTWDRGELEDRFIYGMVSNSVSVGGFRGLSGDHVVLDDGAFEVLLIRMPQSIKDLNQITAALVSRQPNENFIALQTGEISFSSDEPVDWSVDGEYGGALNELKIKNMPCHVTILSGRREGTEE